LKARQLGISTSFLLYHFDDVLFKPNLTSVVLANKFENCGYLFSILRTAYDNLPPSIKPKLTKETGSIMRFEHGSEISVSIEIRAKAISGSLHISEAAFCEPERIVASLAACAPMAHISIESTPHSTNHFWKMFFDAKDGKTDFKSAFFPWYSDPTYKISLGGLKPPEPNPEERKLNLSGEQILFRRQMKARFGKAFDSEFCEDEISCFGSSSANFFDIKKILTLSREARTIKPLSQNNLITVWERPTKNHRYVCGCDVSEGFSQDFSAFKIMCVDCNQEAFSFRGKVGLDNLALRLAETCTDYNLALLGVEKNSIGTAILIALREIHKYPNLFYESRQTRPQSDSKAEIKYGWTTTHNSKAVMLHQFKQALEGDSEADENNFQPEFKVFDSRLLDECLSFRDENGRLSAIGGAHDDLLMASGICFQLFKRANHKPSWNGVYVGPPLQANLML
jgi:hypothetical protein